MATFRYPTSSAIPSGVLVEAASGVLRAQAVTVAAVSGAVTRVGGAVTMTAGGSSYGETITGEQIAVPAYVGAGESGAFESSGRRYSVALSDLGITFAGTKRWCHLQAHADSFTDGGEARAGTQAVLTWVGSGAATDAVCGVGFQRPATGTAYLAGHFDTSDASLISISSTITMRGVLSRFLTYSADFGQLHSIALDADGDYIAGSSTSGATATNAAPTHLCVGLYRAGTNPSAFVVEGYRALYYFGPPIGGAGL